MWFGIGIFKGNPFTRNRCRGKSIESRCEEIKRTRDKDRITSFDLHLNICDLENYKKEVERAYEYEGGLKYSYVFDQNVKFLRRLMVQMKREEDDE